MMSSSIKGTNVQFLLNKINLKQSNPRELIDSTSGVGTKGALSYHSNGYERVLRAMPSRDRVLEWNSISQISPISTSMSSPGGFFPLS